ncbi:homoserine O-acetyltransferase family protein [Algivirga pacifica]
MTKKVNIGGMKVHTYKHTEDFILESGEVLPGFELEYNTMGELKEGVKIVWVCHALTGNADVKEWWNGLFGKGKLYNEKEHFVICANVLGSCYGSTGPLSTNPKTGKPYFHDFPQVTIKDIARSLNLLRESLEIGHIDTLIGASLGGQQALEWSIQCPDLFENLIVVASNAQHSPWGIAFNESQRLALQADPTWYENREDAGQNGLRAARAIAMLSYRHYETYSQTQTDKQEEQLDNYKASSYQRYQGDKLVERFNAYSYWVLSKAMDAHHVGRGRGGLQKALKSIKAKTLIIGISSDVLFPVNEQRLIAEHIPSATYHELESLYGHDGFLVHFEELKECIDHFYYAAERVQLQVG